LPLVGFNPAARLVIVPQKAIIFAAVLLLIIRETEDDTS